MAETELNPSKLGTLEYWEEAYEKEIENFNENGDEGEVWFGIHTAKKVVSWLKNKNCFKDSNIIDIGTGNGYTCIMLAEQGYTNLTGIDYSEKAVNLAKLICEKKELKIDYRVLDVLEKNECMENIFDIAIDKGTYDAIALQSDPKIKRLKYKEFLCKTLKPNNDSLFIITSCNWTTKELTEFFTSNNEFEQIDEIKSQSFSFGGSTGATTSTVVFKLKK